jgi:uncharacterized protein
MPASLPDPLRLDVASFAAESARLDGDFAIAELPRLASSECPPEGGVTDRDGASMIWSVHPEAEERRVRWHAQGELRSVAGLPPEVWLTLKADATVLLQCQRCLRPLAMPVEAVRAFRFVDDEETAAALDEEIEDDVLVLPRALDLRALVEDEMLLALPVVPRHEQCPETLPRSFGDDELEEDIEHPFSKLAILRKDREGDGGPEIG